MRFYQFWKKLDETNRVYMPQLINKSGGADVINCMKQNGAKVVNIYQLLVAIEKGTQFQDSVFLGLQQDNNILTALAELAGGTHWTETDMDTSASNTNPFLEELVKKGKKIVFCVQNVIDAYKGFTHKEFMWLANNCKNPQVMKQLTIVVGLYSVVGEEELQPLLNRYGRVDVEKMKSLLMNWRQNLSKKTSTPGYVTKHNFPYTEPPDRNINFTVNDFVGKIIVWEIGEDRYLPAILDPNTKMMTYADIQKIKGSISIEIRTHHREFYDPYELKSVYKIQEAPKRKYFDEALTKLRQAFPTAPIWQ